jgi:hypothetical protein
MITLPHYPGLSFRDSPRIIINRGPRYCHEGEEGQHKVVQYTNGARELWVKTTHGYAIHDEVP